MKIISDFDIDNTLEIKENKLSVKGIAEMEARISKLESYFTFHPEIGSTGSTMLDIRRVYGFNIGKLSATDNLNNITTPGIYSVTSSSFATPANNYPVEKQVGEIYVSANSQLYIIKNNIDSRLWIRFYNAGNKTWSQWVKII